MHIERFFVPGLANASYLVASGNEAVAVDPERNVDGYLAYLSRNKLNLNGIFLTHPHADFVAGHTELSARSGAPIFVSDKAPATFVHNDLKDGDRLALAHCAGDRFRPRRSPRSARKRPPTGRSNLLTETGSSKPWLQTCPTGRHTSTDR